MTNELKIPADVGEYCRKAALVLQSSERFLNAKLKEQGAWAEADEEADWLFMVPHEDVETTRDNLREGAKFLNWLAEHAAAFSEVKEG